MWISMKKFYNWLPLIIMLIVLYLSLFINIPIEIISAIIVISTISSSILFFGKKAAIKIIVICFVVGAIAEILSLNTGIPFGFYHYTSVLQPQLFGLPIFIPFLWFSLFFISMLAYDLNIIPIVMVFLDLMLDPIWSNKLWKWLTISGEPSVWNIPLTNFLGWFFVSYIIFLLINKYAIKDIKSKIITSEGKIFFCLFALNIFIKFLLTLSGNNIIYI
jgi:putative membrane protein